MIAKGKEINQKIKELKNLKIGVQTCQLSVYIWTFTNASSCIEKNVKIIHTVKIDKSVIDFIFSPFKKNVIKIMLDQFGVF